MKMFLLKNELIKWEIKARESERQRPVDGRLGRVLPILEQRKRGVEIGVERRQQIN
jgi:hypothetical protein